MDRTFTQMLAKILIQDGRCQSLSSSHASDGSSHFHARSTPSGSTMFRNINGTANSPQVRTYVGTPERQTYLRTIKSLNGRLRPATTFTQESYEKRTDPRHLHLVGRYVVGPFARKDHYMTSFAMIDSYNEEYISLNFRKQNLHPLKNASQF